MPLALTEIWVDKDQAGFSVKIQDGNVCNTLGPMDEHCAHKIHAHIIDAVFEACLKQLEELKDQQISQERQAA